MSSAPVAANFPMMSLYALVLTGLDLEISEDIFAGFVENVGFDGIQYFFRSSNREMGAVVEVFLIQVYAFQRNEIGTGIGCAAPDFRPKEAWFVVVGAVGNNAGRWVDQEKGFIILVWRQLEGELIALGLCGNF